MVDINRLIDNQLADNLFKLSEERDNYSLISRLLKDMFDDETNDATERDKRDEISLKNNQVLANLQKETFTKIANGLFEKLEKRSKSTTRSSICSEEITESSAYPIVVQENSNVTKINKTILLVAGMLQKSDDIIDCFVDTRNENFYTVPFHKVVCRSTDRKILVHASTCKVPQDYYDSNKEYAYEFGWVNNLNQKNNKQISDVIYEYLHLVFEGESQHIKTLLQCETTTVIMVLNIEKNTDNIIDVSNIVSLVMFGNDDWMGTCIDFISTTLPFTGMSFGPFLLHTAQVIGSRAIQRRTDDSVKENFTTVLSCRKDLIFYYERLGFVVYSKEPFMVGGEFQGAGVRFEIDKWESNKSELHTMRCNCLCSRLINQLSTFPIDLEKAIYDDTNPFPE